MNGNYKYNGIKPLYGYLTGVTYWVAELVFCKRPKMFTYVLEGSPVYMTSFCLGQSFQPKLGHCVKSGYDSKRNGTERKGTLLRLSYPPHGTSSPKSKGTWVLVTWDWKCLSSLSHERSGPERSGDGRMVQGTFVIRSGAEWRTGKEKYILQCWRVIVTRSGTVRGTGNGERINFLNLAMSKSFTLKHCDTERGMGKE